MQFKSLLTSALVLALSATSAYAGHGRVSFYDSRPTKSAPGSCGSDYIVDYYIALNDEQYKGDLCGKCIKIVYNNKYIVGELVDVCPGCSYGGLDISPSMFEHFEDKREGVFDADWEYVSCDNYGKKGTCSGSDCGMSSSSSKATTTTKSQTTTTTTTVANATTSDASKPTATNTSANANATTTTSTTVTATATATATQTASSDSNQQNNNSTTSSANTNENENGTNKNNDGKGNAEVGVIDVDKEDSSSSIVLPLTGALMVTGAAGVGLLYATKSKHEDVQSLKQKFPDAFKTIKRSLTNGSSIRRKMTRTYTKNRPHLPTTNDDVVAVDNVNNNTTSTTSTTNNIKEMDISETRININ